VHDAVDIMPSGVNGAVDDEAGQVNFLRSVYDIPVQVQRDEIGGGNLVVSQAEAVDEEIIGARDAGRDVVVDEVGVPEQVRQTISSGEVHPHSPLLFAVTSLRLSWCSHGVP